MNVTRKELKQLKKKIGVDYKVKMFSLLESQVQSQSTAIKEAREHIKYLMDNFVGGTNLAKWEEIKAWVDSNKGE